ncbi:CKLF-like MARVEL transmembrane domain-containing protein 1 isoform X2 [Macrotis lagotis]|uniref:CKLF-like MARVEL transmembrane domain-containing protein 1 isoform X2 n=1 Tax=Macrotis lagotis TaxID=92651 RepID=UPI003D69F421
MDTTMDPPKWSKGIKMRLRAEGRQKVQSKVTAGLFRYLISGPGIVKVIRLMLNLGAVVSFIMAPAQESYIAILLLECCIVLSFIIIYVLGLHHLLVCILWPAFDIVNCLLTSGFLIVIGILVLWEEGIDVLIVSGANYNFHQAPIFHKIPNSLLLYSLCSVFC